MVTSGLRRTRGVRWLRNAAGRAADETVFGACVTRRAVPRLWREAQAQALRIFYGDLDMCELADLGGVL